MSYKSHLVMMQFLVIVDRLDNLNAVTPAVPFHKLIFYDLPVAVLVTLKVKRHGAGRVYAVKKQISR